jgi:hypothetical protein
MTVRTNITANIAAVNSAASTNQYSTRVNLSAVGFGRIFRIVSLLVKLDFGQNGK